jgi:CheY-like chemotaxis protein/anti-sigma regulatory factor (Ser/Thr protein kinase)
MEGKGIEFFKNNGLPFDKAVVKTDREKIFAILTNLVKNAIKFTETGSVEIGYIQKDEYLEFYVTDSGIGVDDNRQVAIFERFMQADISDSRAYEGAGLGLSISKAFVEMLGGELRIESKKGEGSSFYFTIPHTNNLGEKANKETGIQIDSAGFQTKKLKILIVEDDETSDLLLTIRLDDISREILHAGNGVEAIEACRNNPDIDLILMDIKMPVMDGHQATKEIRKFNKDLIIIAQTAHAFEGDKEKAIEFGCNECLSKPVVIKDLMSLIESYFNEK